MRSLISTTRSVIKEGKFTAGGFGWQVVEESNSGLLVWSQTRYHYTNDLFNLFLPEYVSVTEWQFGQSKRRFSILLSLFTPLTWSSCNDNCFPCHSPSLPQWEHLYSNNPSFSNLFFKLLLFEYFESSTSISSRECLVVAWLYVAE